MRNSSSSYSTTLFRLFFLTAIILWACTALPKISFAREPSKQMIGWVENVQIYPSGLRLNAKADTGAENSSIKAKNIKIFEKNGTQRVKFTTMNKEGRDVDVDLPLVRTARIKSREAGLFRERPVVKMGICLGSVYKIVEVNLAPRTGFNYHIILGRSFLKENFIVDVERTFTAETACKEIILP